MSLEFSDIVLRHSKSVVESRSQCDTSAELGNYTFAVPVVAANMKSILNRDICKLFDSENWFYVYPRIDGPKDVFEFAYKYCEINELRVRSISVGVRPEWIELIKSLHEYGVRLDYITVDVALSYNDNVLPVLKTIREFYPEAYVILGNGATKEWVEWVKRLEMVNCIKVGIGVSQSCRTRQYTGFGSSTVSSLSECYDASIGRYGDPSGVDVISDGGITVQDGVVCIGDVAKALSFGADFVMSGALFARCIDSPALVNGYYGNASREAKGNTHVEGELIKVESNGLTIREMMKLIQESLKSSISYAGGTNVNDLFGASYSIRNRE